MTPEERRELEEAEAARKAGRWGQALDLFLGLLRRLAAARRPFTPLDVVVLERTADLAVLLGHTAGADDLYAAAAAACERVGNAYLADYAALKRVHLALSGGRLADARDLLRGMEKRLGPLREIPITPDALPAWETQRTWPNAGPSDRAVLFSRLYLCLGGWLASQGFYGQARVLLERGAFHAGPGASESARQAYLPLRLALAAALLGRGDLGEADAVLAAAEPLLDPHRPGPPEEWLELSGNRHLLSGNFGAALEAFHRVEDVCWDNGFRRAIAAAALNQAHVLIYLNQIDAAEELLAEAREAAAAFGDAPAAARAAWLARLAAARARALHEGAPPTVTDLQEGGAADLARLRARPADEPADPADLPQAADFLAFFDDRALAVQWSLGLGDLAEARRRLARLRDVFAACDSLLVRLRLRLLTAFIAYYGEDYAAAERLLAEACPEMERRGLRPDLWQALRVRTWCAARLGRPAEVREDLARRTDALVQELAATLPPEQQSAYWVNKWTAEERRLAHDVNRLAAARAAVERSPWYLRPWRRWRLWRDLHAFLYRLDARRRALVARRLSGADAGPAVAAVPPLWRRLFGHPWRRAGVGFLVLPDRVFVSRAGWLDLDFAVRPLTRLRLRQLVGRWHRLAHVEAPADDLETVADELTAELGLESLLARLPRRVRALTVVPDDVLYGAPFAALRRGGRPLLDDFALTIDFDRSPSPRPPAPRRGAGLAVAVGREGRDAAAGLEWTYPELPEARREAEQAADWMAWRGLAPATLVDDAADRQAVLEQWARAAVVHVACHGVFEPDRPESSGLVLIPRPDRVERLSLRDLSRLDGRGLEHVTLSNCWSADNFVRPGRWVVGLPETLCRAGAGSVLGCLWRVYDEVGRLLCERFYEYLKTRPRDQALRQALLDCRNNALPTRDGYKTDHPIYWAGYQLYGEHRRLCVGAGRDSAARNARTSPGRPATAGFLPGAPNHRYNDRQ